MATERQSGRVLKRKILELLKSADFGHALKELCRLPARQAVNPLFSFLYSHEALLKWRAVTAMGAVVSGLAADDLESARVVMRRLVWNLNDESGGIGWGSPEAMGEIMAKNERLADEYHKILISYIRPDGNFIEHEALQQGVLWGLGRLAQVRPQLVRNAYPLLGPYMESDDPVLRGLAAWTAGALEDGQANSTIEHLKHDNTRIKIYLNGNFIEIPINKLLKEDMR